jgi:glycine cleavage system regulatory protein
MAMVILTLGGPDRPGLISRISEQIASRGGSWMESRLAHLAGQFTGIVLASLPEREIDALRHAFAGLAAEGLHVTLHLAHEAAQAAPAPPLSFSLVCQDRPGIIRDITRVLAVAHVNIEELSTDVTSGSFSGEAMFHAEARLRLPAGLDVEEVRRDLERLGNELMVDIQVGEAVIA